MDYIVENLQPYKDSLNNFMKSKNVNVSKWLFMDTLYPTVYLTLVYLLLVIIILPKLMKKRQTEFQLKYLIFSYNILSIALNLYITFKIFKIKYKSNDFALCTSIRANDETSRFSKKATEIAWYFYLSKLIEFLDTILFILQKRFHHLTWLHIYHHSTMFALCWFCVNYYTDGTSTIFIFINSVIHVIMYVYYASTVFGGEQFRRLFWWKHYLTLIQMLQFFIAIIYSSFLLHSHCEYRLNDRVLWFTIFYSMTHLVLFYNTETASHYKRKLKSDKANDSDLCGNTSSLLDSSSEFTLNVSRRRPLRSP